MAAQPLAQRDVAQYGNAHDDADCTKHAKLRFARQNGSSAREPPARRIHHHHCSATFVV